MLSFKKHDAFGQLLIPGDVCIRTVKDGNFNKRYMEFCVYKGASKGGSNSKGSYGRFITPEGESSLKCSSVVSVFDPMGTRRAKTPEVDLLIRRYYESIR